MKISLKLDQTLCSSELHNFVDTSTRMPLSNFCAYKYTTILMNHVWTEVNWKNLGIQYWGGLTHLKRKYNHLMNMQGAHCTCGKHSFLRQCFIINNRELRQLNVVHPRHRTSSLPVELNVICSVAIWETKEGQKHLEIHIYPQNIMLAQRESSLSHVPKVCVVSSVNQHVNAVRTLLWEVRSKSNC